MLSVGAWKLILAPWAWPGRARALAYGLAVAVLLYLCLAPSKALPHVSLWDKAEHSIAWAVLTGVGLTLWPARAPRVAVFALALGAVVEVLQGVLPLGRDADWRDLVADSVGVIAALAAWAAVYAGALRRERAAAEARGG